MMIFDDTKHLASVCFSFEELALKSELNLLLLPLAFGFPVGGAALRNACRRKKTRTAAQELPAIVRRC